MSKETTLARKRLCDVLILADDPQQWRAVDNLFSLLISAIEHLERTPDEKEKV